MNYFTLQLPSVVLFSPACERVQLAQSFWTSLVSSSNFYVIYLFRLWTMCRVGALGVSESLSSELSGVMVGGAVCAQVQNAGD